MSRIGALVSWVMLFGLAFGPLAPAARPDQTEWILRLLQGRWQGENPAVAAQFAIMGVWPLLAALLYADRWRSRPLPLWPFHLASLAVGCFVLLPGLALTRPDRPGPPAPAWALHPAAPALLGAIGAALLAWGLLAGDLAGFAHTFRTDGFVWAMTFDFFAFPLLFLIEARSRAGESRAPWALTLVPILGAALWLARRAPAAGPRLASGQPAR